jgi:hypothetical protein
MLKEAGPDGFRDGPVPVRTRPKVVAVWIHPHEMASHEYFWGGWMSVVVEADQWVSGLRIYFGNAYGRLVIILAGGTKRTQSEDIAQAKLFWKEWKGRREAK